ncbi:MAG: serine hydrolase [Patescibacteria group bacterium]
MLSLILIFILLNPLSNVYPIDKPFFNTTTSPLSVQNNNRKNDPIKINPENIGVKVSAKRFAAIDLDSGQLLLQKDSNLRQPIASITKLMTALIILDQKPNWSSEVTMTAGDETVGAFPHIYRGEQVRFIDLWKSALVASDNNSILAMIRNLGLSREEFIQLMNKKADELDMDYTDFSDPTGLSEKNLSTALDVARLLQAAMQKNEIRESVLQPSYSFKILNSKRKNKVNNTDVLVGSFLNDAQHGYELIGGKTGYLEEAGYCLGVMISRDGHKILIVVLNSPSIQDRFQDVKAIADWVYSNYQWGI